MLDENYDASQELWRLFEYSSHRVCMLSQTVLHKEISEEIQAEDEAGKKATLYTDNFLL